MPTPTNHSRTSIRFVALCELPDILTFFGNKQMQALDTGEKGHSTSYAVGPGRKPLNRFGNIVVCKSVVVSGVVSTASSYSSQL